MRISTTLYCVSINFHLIIIPLFMLTNTMFYYLKGFIGEVVNVGDKKETERMSTLKYFLINR